MKIVNIEVAKCLNIPSAKKLLLDNKCLSLPLAPIVYWKMVTHFPVVKSAQNTTTESESEIVSQRLYKCDNIFCKSKFLSATEQQLCTLATSHWNWARLQILFLQRKKSIFRFSTSEWPVAGPAWTAGVTLDLTLSCPPNSPPGWAALRQWTNQRPASGRLTNQSAANPAVWQLHTAGPALQASLYTAECAAEALSGPWLSLSILSL